MHARATSRVKRGFTLVEILIVVVILGILAAIVIPQFTNASQEAQASSVQSQLQTVRSQIELYRVKTGEVPNFTANGWDDLLLWTNPFTGQDERFLQAEPRNAMRGNATGIVIGTAVPPAASGGGADDGWYWNSDSQILYALDRDANLLDF